MPHITQFTDAAAVEAWDAWFRWRDGNRLHDRTIDSTWTRIADAIAVVEGAKAPQWANRFVDAFSQWRLLPGERLLQAAGTGRGIDDDEPLRATLNLAAFVVAGLSASARMDFDRIADIAALAVRLLDDAWLAVPRAEASPTRLRIGVIGLADALHLQNVPYDSVQARQLARKTAIALANGALRGSIELASERGANGDQAGLVSLWRERGTPATLIDDASRWGIRHAQLTAIESQPRLALLANNVCDALDPMIRPPGAASNHASAAKPAQHDRDAHAQRLLSQAGMRGAMQPWIDAPIDYPLISLAEPSQDELATLTQLAAEQGLPRLAVRTGTSAIPISTSIQGG